MYSEPGIQMVGGYGPPPGPPGGYGPPVGGPPGGAWGPPPPGPPGFGPPGFGPPQGTPPGYTPASGADLESKATFWFIVGIIAAGTGCCLPLGVPAAYFGHEAKECIKRGDFVGAEQKISNARICGIICAVVVGLGVLVWVGMMVLGIAVSAGSRP